MKKLIFIALVATQVGVSCSSDKEKEETDALYEEVMVVHDEVMPRMQEIMQLKQKLRAEIVELEDKQDSVSDQNIQQYEMIISELDQADKAMMQWMRAINKEYDTLSYEDAKAYLLVEKQRINEVKNDMNAAIEKAENIVR